MAEKKRSFEESMARLEEIVTQLEKGEAPLEESLKLFEEGTGLVRLCDGNYHGWRAWGEGVLPMQRYLHALDAMGYRGDISLRLPGERYLAQKIYPVFCRRLGGPALSEYLYLFAAVGAFDVAHVLNDAEDGDIHLFRHAQRFFHDHRDQFLRR